MRAVKRACLAGLIAAIASPAPSACAAQASPRDLPINFYGVPGLLDMPSAHMEADGTLRLSASYADFTRRFSLSFQALPWLETSFHYIGTRHLNSKYNTYYDRSFGLKIRLQNEVDGWPDITVGIRDIVGTSLNSGEYLAASKHIGPLDFTAGIGWGRLAGTGLFKNPFTYVLSSFKKRSKIASLGGTGQIQFGQFFRGPKASLFGGIAWNTPLKGLTLIGEYSSDNYQLERQRGVFKPSMQFDFGASYELTDWAKLTGAWMFGNTIMMQLSISADPKVTQATKLGPPPLAANIRSENVLRRLAGPQPVLLEPAVASVSIDDNEFIIATRGDATASDVVCDRLTRYLNIAYQSGFREVTVYDVDAPKTRVRFCRDDTPTAQERLALFIGPSAAAKAEKEAKREALRDAARDRAITEASAQGLKIQNLSFENDTVDLAFENTNYRTEDEAYGRLARVLMDTMPADIEEFRFTSLVAGMPTREMDIPRSSLERAIAADGGAAELLPFIKTSATGPAPKILSTPLVEPYPRFDWAIRPQYNQSLFDPDQPYRFQVLLGLMGGVDIARGLRVQGQFQVNLFDDFAHLRGSNSVLPHVRSDFKKYFAQGKTGIAQLQTSYRTTLDQNLYGEVKAGYLENMFAGAGGEVLWRPEGKRWAIGVSAYEVWQRGFDRLLDLRHYHVFTGHVSFYYQLPYYGLNFRVHAGRYLAGDYGATVELLRRFDTGVEIGMFATFTNVPFEKFGEGSFDKGIIIILPVDWLLPVNSQSTFDMTLKPLTRDGGQMLNGEYDLYDATTRTSYGQVFDHIDDIVSP